jgi:hypothetical protein
MVLNNMERGQKDKSRFGYYLILAPMQAVSWLAFKIRRVYNLAALTSTIKHQIGEKPWIWQFINGHSYFIKRIIT